MILRGIGSRPQAPGHPQAAERSPMAQAKAGLWVGGQAPGGGCRSPHQKRDRAYARSHFSVALDTQAERAHARNFFGSPGTIALCAMPCRARRGPSPPHPRAPTKEFLAAATVRLSRSSSPEQGRFAPPSAVSPLLSLRACARRPCDRCDRNGCRCHPRWEDRRHRWLRS